MRLRIFLVISAISLIAVFLAVPDAKAFCTPPASNSSLCVSTNDMSSSQVNGTLAASCPSASSLKCQYICDSGYKMNNGISCSAANLTQECNASTGCGEVNGKYCRRFGMNSYGWYTENELNTSCNENNLCETVECGSDSSRKLGICVIDSKGNYIYKEGTVACPYSLVAQRNFVPADNSIYHLGDQRRIKVYSSTLPCGVNVKVKRNTTSQYCNHYSCNDNYLDILTWSKICHPGNTGGPQLSYEWKDNAAVSFYSDLMPSKCMSEGWTGTYNDNYHIGKVSASDSFSTDCSCNPGYKLVGNKCVE